MAIMLDADVIIRGEKGTFDLATWMTQHGTDGFEVAAITVAELWYGVERASGDRRGKREAYIRTILEELPKIPYTETTALQHARIWASLESSGRMIGDYDLIVAATAIERGSAVATFNKRHFENVRGLKVIEPK
jgi:tRNA(fMet)-specific endonuclease VapC